MSVWLTNERVAWQIPSGRIARFFLLGAYLPPEGWQVKRNLEDDGWRRGECGELRKEVGVHEHE